MDSLGIKELKKVLIALFFPLAFIIIIVLISMSAFSATSSEETASVKGLLTSDIGQKLYNDIWKKPLHDIYTETHINVPLAWVVVPSCYLKDAFIFDYNQAKKIGMLAIDKTEGHKLVKLEIFIERLLNEKEFKGINKSDLKEIIEKNQLDFNIATVGNVPKELNDYLQLKRCLPVKKWNNIYEVGLYNPFGEWTMHYGMDIAVPTGTELFSAIEGEVILNTYGSTGGNQMMIRNGSLIIFYAHLNSSLKKVGDKVECGELVGYTGATGKVTGPHLHFETWSTNIKNPGVAFSNGMEEQIFFNPRLIFNFD